MMDIEQGISNDEVVDPGKSEPATFQGARESHWGGTKVI